MHKPGIIRFFVFMPNHETKEGNEHEKLVFYHPAQDSRDTQVRSIGFCEAIVRFTSSFCGNMSECHVTHTEKQLHFYFQPEQNFLMGMVVKKDAGISIQEDACAALLQTSYRMHRLFFGQFQYNYDIVKNDLTLFRSRIKFFFERHVTNIKMSSIPLLDILQGVNFMPLERSHFINLQSLINRLGEIFPCIKHSVFLYNTSMLYSSIPNDDLCVFYRYLAYNLLPAQAREEMHLSTKTSSRYGRFATGPDNLDSPTETKVPSLFIRNDTNNSNSFTAYQLIIYRCLNATLCMLIDKDETLDIEFYRNIDSVFGAQLTPFASRLGDVYEKISFQSPHSYIYFNAQTKSLRTSFETDGCFNPTGTSNLSSLVKNTELMQKLCLLRHDLMAKEHFGELIVKFDSDIWLTAKRGGQRELYVIISQRNMSLTEASEELKRLCQQHFSNFFINE